MSRARFILSVAAKTDLLKIGRFSERRWGKAQRNYYLKQIDDAFQFIASNPQIGKDASRVREGYRKFPVGEHVICYQAGTGEVVEMNRVLHRKMDAELHFSSEV